MKIKILSDSTCDLSREQLNANDITLFPLTVVKNDVAFKDGVDINPADIFAHVAAGGALCSTSAGSVGEYADLFEKYASAIFSASMPDRASSQAFSTTKP